MPRINTALTNLLDIETPIVSAPMAGASGGSLAGQVSAAGAFGFLGAGLWSADQLQKELSISRSILKLKDTEILPVGVGYLGWQLEQSRSNAENLMSISLEQRVRAIWLAFGNDLGSWVRFIREYDSRRNHKTLVFVIVSSVESAVVAADHWKVDVLVAQGNEAGGHGMASSPPLLTLVSAILAAMPQDGPLVIAAGGLSNGRHVASMLVLGAAGVVLGTRFLLTPESQYKDVQKEALLHAKANSTVRSMAFDRVRGTLEWPEGVDGRGLYNDTVKDMDAGIDFAVVKERFEDGTRRGDVDRMVIWAGTGVGLMSEIKEAKDIVSELHNDTVASLKTASVLINQV
ncbi:2-nitropropane dioxygenase [Hygrophoropsis aurantiaca]|uniref:2-nitropropane dioxygenase n=1 Tax=Hygrophoropsis aurantiaca TaxID=72124 RepID=A0ACB8AIT2_9AGAM|nr:2-nitropropane dioxygenase [Hygrophoropsis aurantiaca]